MNTTEYLDGAVVVHRLGASPADGLFRAADARGEVAWTALGEPAEYVHVVEFAAADVRRGFHLHPGHVERLYLFRGTLRVFARAPARPETAEFTLHAGELATFAEEVAHGFLSTEPALAVSMGSGTNPLQNTVPTPDLAPA